MADEVGSFAEIVRNQLFNYPELFQMCPHVESAAPWILLQFHWQNLRNISETVFVAQGGPFSNFEEAEAWIGGVATRHQHERPEGWCPLLCNQDSDYFVEQSPTPTGGAFDKNTRTPC